VSQWAGGLVGRRCGLVGLWGGGLVDGGGVGDHLFFECIVAWRRLPHARGSGC
jgi:hypothetical protein